ncbi:PREDICTED: uncharacterized protein At4g04775-like [Camelina sativa]|uniref:Uncharacterized protein At4g04775-like n=1 Tax=Camelina sativa TaxID=90675 RepID=A0ABM0TSZ7_CAMSA|nr:PREDICTED: uncharacterized protein At4g04775-like [Camelina sativa]
MSSSSSSGSSFTRRGTERGIPRKCRCGVAFVVKTSETMNNLGRLFHCCSYGSKENNEHLFKWTDISMVEEMEEVESVVGKIKVDVESLAKGLNAVKAEMESLAMETRTCEAVCNSYENEIQAIKAVAQGCEKEIEELKAVIACCEK